MHLIFRVVLLQSLDSYYQYADETIVSSAMPIISGSSSKDETQLRTTIHQTCLNAVDLLPFNL